jgi:uncharacterized protein
MKKLLIILFLISLISVNAQEFPNYYDKYVNDFAHLFNNDQVNELRTLLNNVERNTTAEIVVVTLNSTYPLTPSEYRNKLFNYWKIGKEEKDNGLLILYSIQENRIEVETGYGLEGILPDSKLGRLLDENYVPCRDKKEISQGIILFTREVTKIINENKEEVYSNSNQGWNYTVLNYIMILFPYIILILVILSVMRMVKANRKKCEKDGLIMKYAGLIGGYYIYKCAKGHIHKEIKPGYSGGFFGGFGGGFGGGGFGGGMSGGGGVGR